MTLFLSKEIYFLAVEGFYWLWKFIFLRLMLLICQNLPTLLPLKDLAIPSTVFVQECSG